MYNKTIDNNCYFLYSNLTPEVKLIYKDMIYRFLFMLNFEYRGFYEWYDRLFISKYELDYCRDIIICERNFELAGVAIIKNDECEKKICTLRVSKKYRNNGIGHRLIELSMEYLNTEKPMITLHKNKFNQFEHLLDYYNFNLEQTKKNYYYLFNKELVYNGCLPDRNTMVNATYDYVKWVLT